MMKKLKLLSTVASISLLSLSTELCLAGDEGRPEKPNIILLLTDDLGWQDVKCYDVDKESPMETPHIDALAKKGVQFWQGYSPAPTCAPTRCAIISGIHPARAQKTHVVGGAPPAPYGKHWKMMAPWYSGRTPVSTYTLAESLQDAGYTTGHCGKWHIAISHNSYPQPMDHGFDWTQSNLGVTRRMKPNRLTGFSTKDEGDKYKLNEDGFSTHQNSLDALTFVNENADKPFFLFYATWLVHTPIHTRNERLLNKYCKKLGVERPKGDPDSWTIEGQNNPFYCAMVEELDYYVGQLVTHLETTDDPRWPGHKLSENTYVIFTSDNGGMEKMPNQIITDNYPLDKGKISAMEGGVRVPLIITGPNIPKGVESQVMVNGLDFYPTILSWAGAKAKPEQALDGCDISKLLTADPKDAKLIKDGKGKVRDAMIWHFPHSVALETAYREGDYRLIKNYNHVGYDKTVEYELYRLYDSSKGAGSRVDIEESKNLATEMPEKVKSMAAKMDSILDEMDASFPYYNPRCGAKLPHKEKIPEVESTVAKEGKVSAIYKENGAKIKEAHLIYTLNAGHKYEEWFREVLTVDEAAKTVSGNLPKGTTHYFINLVDENQFMVSYPEIDDKNTRGKKQPSTYAKAVE